MSHLYSVDTEFVTVHVQPEFIESESTPSGKTFIWGYHITIENKGNKTIQLISRYWHICDGNGLVQEVRGEGVVGEQPVIKPGSKHEYTSSVSLNTPSGIMHGSYHIITDDNEALDAKIPVFSLDSDDQLRLPN